MHYDETVIWFVGRDPPAGAYEPVHFGLGLVTGHVEMDAVLGHLWFRHLLEPQPRAATIGLDQHARIVLRVVDADAAQPFQLGVVVGRDRVAVERGGPEA